MILLAAQCRAARGLLGWSQQKLAQASGVAVNTIINFESGRSQARPDTQLLLQQLFAQHGVVLQAPCGVALQQGQASLILPHQVPSFVQGPLYIEANGAVWVKIGATNYWVVAEHSGLAQLVEAANLDCNVISSDESP